MKRGSSETHLPYWTLEQVSPFFINDVDQLSCLFDSALCSLRVVCQLSSYSLSRKDRKDEIMNYPAETGPFLLTKK